MHRKFGDHWIRYRDPLDLMESTIYQTWRLAYVDIKKESIPCGLTIAILLII